MPARRSFSQAPTSFIASCYLGIHHVPFLTLIPRRSRVQSPTEVNDRHGVYPSIPDCNVKDLRVEAHGFEPRTPCVQSRCSPN
uniref:Uncharacterized protein n=1 Tax=uncultured delta proteobacterium HF0010_01J10 TaxID=710820 RepID=E0XQD4_9DELT|nr:hypothetical protein [uncultured delta proteobacterium HF0010_01J10]